MSESLVIGADVGGTAVKYVVTDASYTPRVEGEIFCDPTDPGHTLDDLAGTIRSRLGAAWGDVETVGFACAGIVDPVAGRLGRAPNLPGWEGTDLAALAGAAFAGLPAVLANDVNAALMGEWRLGAGRGCRDLLMLALGTGVGGGIVVHGSLLVGGRCGAAELGHMILDREGPACGCGNRGCLEAYASASGLMAEARRRAAVPGADLDLVAFCSRTDADPRGLAALAVAGNAEAVDIYARAGTMLGLAVGNLVNALDPDRVIIGGGVAQAGDLLLATCRAEVPRVVLGERSKSVPIVLADLGPRAAALGAAVMALDEVAGG